MGQVNLKLNKSFVPSLRFVNTERSFVSQKSSGRLSKINDKINKMTTSVNDIQTNIDLRYVIKMISSDKRNTEISRCTIQLMNVKDCKKTKHLPGS